MKIWTNGKHLWSRTVGSTIIGEGVDSFFFYTIGFFGTLPFSAFIILILSAYFFKVAYEIIATPLTYLIVGWLKHKEGVDVFDHGVNYNPFG